jgi:hypothetical protein
LRIALMNFSRNAAGVQQGRVRIGVHGQDFNSIVNWPTSRLHPAIEDLSRWWL